MADSPETAPTLPATPADGGGTSADDELGSLASVMAALARTDGVAMLAPGALVADQYRIERVLGVGGMGAVFLAHDQRLGREVAIKLGNTVSRDGLQRLEREAAALARLAHPNVVVVHQVGELSGRVFIVMEHVTGGTARQWRAREPRTWRAVLALYLAAGDGLAAAHAAGLVHRDFKPDNVLVGADGRPRVADFGLARPAGEAAPVDPQAAADGALTATGAVLGTPAYMPPEQLAGGEVDARADQFAFCASLWEALFGARPFDGTTTDELRTAIEREAPRRGLGQRGIPGGVVAALRRGLAPRPDRRWPDLAALLTALRRARDRRRRVLVGAGVVTALAAGATALVAATGAPAADPCTDGPARIGRVWGPARQAALRGLLPPDVGARVVQRVDDYARRWALGHRDACRATRVARSQSETMLERRELCLARLAAGLDATVAVLERSEPARARADELLGGLGDVDACAAIDALGAEDPPPADPSGRPRLLEATAAVARAEAMMLAAVDPDVGAVTAQALELARATGWRPEIARALVAVAGARWLAGDNDGSIAALDEAAELAIASHADATTAIALADVSWVLADAGRHGEAARTLRLAEAVGRGRDRKVARRLGLTRVRVALQAERYDDAIAAARQRVADAEHDAPIDLAAAHVHLLEALSAGQRFDDLAAQLAVSLPVLTDVLGPDDPRIASAYHRQAVVELTRGRLDDAQAWAEKALALHERRYGPDDWHVDDELLLLGEVANQRGDRAGAAASWSRALANAERRGGEGGAEALFNLAMLDLQAGDAPSALARASRALAILEASIGAESPHLVMGLEILAEAERAVGRLPDARAHLERAIALGMTHLGAANPQTVSVRLALASTMWAAGDRAGARRLVDEVAAGGGADQAVAAWRAAHARSR